jgi:cytochrome c biogenesis protein CcmG/thiol:disulfide interchange protein DsbE
MQKEEPLRPRRRRRVPLAVAGPVTLALVLALAFLATRPLGGEPQPSFFVIGSAGPGVRIGEIAPGTARAPAPELALRDLDGAPLELRAFEDQPLWIIFWKTACEPCEAEAPDVAAAYSEHRAEGLAVVAIDVWDTPAAVEDYNAGHPLDYPIAIDTSSAFMNAYGVWGAPTHYFIGSDGVIRDRYFGPMTPDLIQDALQRIIPPVGS